MFEYRNIVRGILLFALLSVWLCASENDLTDQEKLEAFEARKETVEQRLIDHSRTVPEEKKALIGEVLAYNSGQISELILVPEIMSPNSDPLNQLYPIKSLRVDSRTLPIFETLLRESDDSTIRAKIVWRIRDEALSGGLSMSDEMSSLLEAFLQDDTIDSDIRRASELTLRQVSEMEANGELVAQNHNPVVELGVEISAIPPAAVETTEEAEVKEPTKVKPVEAAEETHEESSQWWLWLIGALVVLGGAVLVVRRKN